MITENLSTLKIHNLTKEQYERELAAGRIDENALYLIPYEQQIQDGQVQSDWYQTDETASDYIKNKPSETTPEDIIEWMCEEGTIIPVASSSGQVYLTNDNKILIL